MKIQYASDLHLEFHENSSWLRRNPLKPVGDVLILAGDIGYLGDDNYSKHPFWKWASDHFETVYAIPGNHELYKYYDINQLKEGWQLDILPNVCSIYNKVIHLTDDIDLVASTLWSHIPREEAYAVEAGVTDFHRILDGEERLSWSRFNQEHDSCLAFIKQSVESSRAKHILVATHHVPSFDLMAEEFKGSKINGAFTSDLNDFMAQLPVEYWIYGHSHRNIDKRIGNTQFLSNQLGYVFANEHLSFLPDRVVEIL